jgi:hypothetical protein
MAPFTGTRRLLIGCALVAAIAVPVEGVLLAAMRTPSHAAAARVWATSLSADDLQDASLRIETYPYFYRRAIMTALEPAGRAQVWRRYLATYAAAHPDLDVAARALLGRAAAAMSADVFDDNPPADHIAELATVFEIGLNVFGRRTAADLFMRLGPDDTSYEQLPVSERMTNLVRDWISVHAASAADCECTSLFPTSCDVSNAAGELCGESNSCDPIVSWPSCGVAWATPCNGVCNTQSHKKS